MNDRKRQVLTTAQRLFVEKGFSATSVQDILEESNISKGTFYNYFSSKNECLLAILDHISDETAIRRRALLMEESNSNIDIFVKQISLQMQVSEEQNLLPLFEAIFHSGDPELRKFIKNYYDEELSWISGRIIDVYGERVAPYVSDCTVLLLGMLQNMTHMWMVRAKGKSDHTKLVHFIMRRMDAIIPDLIDSNDIFIGGNIFSITETNEREFSKQHLVTQLSALQEQLKEDNSSGEKQYLDFLIEELQQEQPRAFLIETITHSFYKAFKESSLKTEAQEIVSKLWLYVDAVNESK